MTWIRDYSKRPYSKAIGDEGLQIRMIGWLGLFLPFWKKGAVPAAVVSALKYFQKSHHRDDGFLGLHTCGVCWFVENSKRPLTHGEFFIDLHDIRYILPDMVVHYIEAHGYKPPKRFCEELLSFWTRNGEELLKCNPEMNNVLPDRERTTYARQGSDNK